MSLKNLLSEDMKTALRAKDSLKLSTIRLIQAAIKQFEIDSQTEADESKIQAIITKMIKQRKDSVKIYTDAGHADRAAREQAEIAVLSHYLPEMLSPQQITHAVEAAISESGAARLADMGKVMALLKNRLSGTADMAEVSKILKAKLSS